MPLLLDRPSTDPSVGPTKMPRCCYYWIGQAMTLVLAQPRYQVPTQARSQVLAQVLVQVLIQVLVQARSQVLTLARSQVLILVLIQVTVQAEPITENRPSSRLTMNS